MGLLPTLLIQLAADKYQIKILLTEQDQKHSKAKWI